MKTLREYIDMIQQLNEGGVTLPNPDGTNPPGAFTADDQVKLNQRMSQQAAQASDAPKPIGSRYDPRLKQTGDPSVIDIGGKQYKWAGREAQAPGTGEVIKIPAGNVGIRGLAPVSVELGADGMYYIAR